MIKKNTKKAGFSLIEVLFAMLFLSVIIFGVIKLQTSNMTLSNTKQLELKAYTYATQGMEIVGALVYDEIKDCTGTCSLKQESNKYLIEGTGPEPLEGDLFERYFTHSEDQLSDASLVTMTVAWTDSSGDHDVSVKRIIAK